MRNEMIVVNRQKILPDVILFNFPLFVHFMFISKVFKLQFRLQSPLPSEAGTLSSTEKKSNWEERIQPRADDSSSQALLRDLDWSSKDNLHLFNSLIHI